MGMDNKFLILDKSKDKLKELQRFIEDIKESDENDNSEYRLSTYEFSIRRYEPYWGLEGEFRNTCLCDLEYWLKSKGKQDIVKDSLIIINYENSDYAVMYNFFDSDYGDELFDIYDNTLCEGGLIFKDVLPLNDIIEYF